jgi:hypothetical protein
MNTRSEEMKNMKHHYMVHPLARSKEALEQYTRCADMRIADPIADCSCTFENVNTFLEEETNEFPFRHKSSFPIFHDCDWSNRALLFEYFNRSNRSGCLCTTDMVCSVHLPSTFQYGLNGENIYAPPLRIVAKEPKSSIDQSRT